MVENLAQLKRYMQVGTRYQMVENVLKPETNGEIRIVNKVQTNAISALRNGGDYWLYWQKAKNMRFNSDNTVDFLFGETVNDSWARKEQESQGKDYWLKIKLLDLK